jgi:hypothetical protein
MMQAGPAIHPTPPISITAAGICADAENTRIASPQRFMIDNSRPVLVEASLMYPIRGCAASRAMTSSVKSERWNCGLV